MKSTYILLGFLFSIITSSKAQDFSLKYGKVTDDELNMKTYANATSAPAVVLYEDGVLYYSYNDGFKVLTDFKKKIKILKQEGTNQASISIPYFNSSSNRDMISGFEAYTYNMENGKQVKSKVEKKYIFDEKLNKNYNLMKFAFPNVKVGSVIEYKYTLTSNRYYSIPDIVLQEDIPVKYLRFETEIPEYFIYSLDSRGYESINTDKKQSSQTFSVMVDNRSLPVTCNTEKTVFSMSNVPALKNEAYVWNHRDYLSSVKYELSGTKFPYDFYKPYSNKWSDIDNTLKDKTDFVSNTRKSILKDEEISAAIAGAKTERDSINAIYTAVKNKIKWNDYYSFFDNDPRDAVGKQTGNNSQINSALISALNNAGFLAYPVLISQRSRGKIPYSHPTIDGLSTFIVGVDSKSSDKAYFLDGSSKYGSINQLPTDLLVDKGYVLCDKKVDKWVNLTNLDKNQEAYVIEGTIGKDGTLSAKMQQYMTNMEAYDFRKKYFESKDSADYIEKTENSHGIKIQNLQWNSKDMYSNKVQGSMDFTKNLESGGDFIYVNPILFKQISTNPFTQSDRKAFRIFGDRRL